MVVEKVSYKKTGIEWMPEVPEHWNLFPIKAVFNERKERNEGNKVTLVLSLLKDIGIIPYDEKGDIGNKMSDSPENYKIAYPGDLVINKMNAVIGSLGVSKYHGVLSQVYFVLFIKDEKEFDLSFFECVFKVKAFQKSFRAISSGIMEIRESIDWHKFKNLLLPVPPIEEQKSIVTYLDFKTRKINLFIQNKLKFIELLKEQRSGMINYAVTKGLNPNTVLKDSCIEWLGKIPAHWQIIPLKYIAKVQSGLALNERLTSKDDVHLPYLRVANVQDGFIDLEEVKYTYVESESVKRFLLKKGDLLMNEGGDFDKLGRGVVWEGQLDPCVHQNHVFAVRFKKGVDPYWVNLLTLTYYGKSYFISKAKQTTNLASLSGTNLKTFPVLIPPQEEIIAIKAWIETESKTINQAILKAEKEIELIKEYKESLIAAAVMGKTN